MQGFLSRMGFVDFLYLILPWVFLFLMLSVTIRETLSPFILGAVTAYILLPLVKLMSKKLRVSKMVAILIIFSLFTICVVYLLSQGVRLLNIELRELTEESHSLSFYLRQNLTKLPDWSQGLTEYLVGGISGISRLEPRATLPFIMRSLDKILSLFVFFITTFYVLKDADTITKLAKKTELTNKIQDTIQNYFKGQLILIAIMSALTWILLTVSGIKYALLLSLFTGIAEVIPYVGPIIAASLSFLVALFTNAQFLGNPPFITAVIVILGYFVLRQLEDLFIIPNILGKSVDIHPLLILFATLMGGKLYGFIGLLFGVPFVATYRVILDFTITKYLQ